MAGTTPGPREGTRLPFLDGLRGLAALYVLLHHAAVAVPPAGMSGAGLVVRFLLRHGHFAVAVFIVLSGYCLARPVVSDPAGRLRGGFRGYLARRAWRILPPYYAALVLSWGLIAAIPALGHPPRTWWDRAVPAFGADTVASHLLLVHNLSPAWLFKVDPPSWSVATEWQIYLLFPVLLAVWRRWGTTAAVAAGFVVGYGIAGLATPLGNSALRQCCPWYAGLFALGMAAAAVSHAGHGDRARPRPSHGRVAAAGLGALALSLGYLAAHGHDDAAFLVGDPLVGLVTALVLVRCTRVANGESGRLRVTIGPVWRGVRGLRRGVRKALSDPPGSGRLRGGRLRVHAGHVGPGAADRDPRADSPLLRLFESRGSLALGVVSYSLYLVHYPLLALADAPLRAWQWGADARLAAHLLVTAPCCLLFACVFHRVFERPFLARRDGAVAPPAPGRTEPAAGIRIGPVARDAQRRTRVRNFGTRALNT